MRHKIDPKKVETFFLFFFKTVCIFKHFGLIRIMIASRNAFCRLKICGSAQIVLQFNADSYLNLGTWRVLVLTFRYMQELLTGVFAPLENLLQLLLSFNRKIIRRLNSHAFAESANFSFETMWSQRECEFNCYIVTDWIFDLHYYNIGTEPFACSKIE